MLINTVGVFNRVKWYIGGISKVPIQLVMNEGKGSVISKA